MAFTEVTLTGTLVDAFHEPVSGWIRFTPTARLHDSVGHEVLTSPAQVDLVDGAFSTVVLATSGDAGTFPDGVGYTVDTLLNGVRLDPYTIVVDTADGATQDIADLTPATLADPVYNYLTQSDAAASYVALTGAQTVAGVKEFTSAPTVGGDVLPGSMLDYAESVAGFTFSGTSLAEITGVVVTFTLASAATVKLSASALASHTGANKRVALYLTDDSDDSIVAIAQESDGLAAALWSLDCWCVVALDAGTHTFRLDGRSPAGSGGSLSTAEPIRLLAERIA